MIFGKQHDHVIVIGGVHIIFSGKSISWSHVHSSLYSPYQVIVLKEQHPVGLMGGQVIQLLEICKVLVVGKDGYQVGCSSEVVSSFLQGMENSKEFPIINVILLHWREGLRVVCTRVQFSIGICLHENSSQGGK